MPIEVTMPKLSPTMETGTLSEWVVKVGDVIKEGDILAQVVTDKDSLPMLADEEGTVVLLDVAEGEEVALGRRVLVMAKKGEDPQQVAASLGGSKSAAPEPKPKQAPAESKAAPAEPSAQADDEEDEEETSEERTNVPSRPEAHPGDSNGQETHGRPHAETGARGRIKSSPLARKVAAASNVDLGKVTGSGPGGRVVRRDVETFAKQRPTAPAPAPARAAPASAKPLAAQRVPHSQMRKVIAKRMVEAKQSAPEIHVTVDIRVDELVSVRERLNKQLAAEKIKLSLGDFVTKAVAMALRRHPGVNASFEPDAIVIHPEVHVGIAVALEGGLIVPVIRNADTLGLREIRTGSEALVDAARQGKLKPEQRADGTFTISNLGMYGVRQFDAILNMPQVGILAVGTAEKRPVVVNDSLAVGTVMTVTLTADHRAVDGALAAEFLRTLKGLLEEPSSMLL